MLKILKILKIQSSSQLEKLIIESKMFEHLKDSVAYQLKIQEAGKRLQYIISRLSDNLINIFRLDSEEGGSDIELTILRAFLNCRDFFLLEQKKSQF